VPQGQIFLEGKMKRYIKSTILSAIISVLIPLISILAQPSPATILQKVDACINGPSDQEMKMKLVLIDKNGKEQTREIMMMQKGSDKRIGKFVSPADQKGIGFLSLPDNVFYIYLPAYKKTRRIASHIKNTKFAGTDFTYEDMEAKNYSLNWNSELINSDNNQYVLQLTPKNGQISEYGKIILSVKQDNFYPERTEYYDKSGKIAKRMTSEKLEKINGYWIAKISLMEDLKSGHKTKMILEDVKFNSGLADNKFTERYLAQ
jgi:outer membrane lipoprotein-sorting protein